MSKPTVTIVTRSALAEICREALKSSKIFRAKNVKKDGTVRDWIIAPKAGRAAINGNGSSRPYHVDMPAVFDLSSVQTRDGKGRFLPAATRNGWRALNLKTLIEVKRGGEIFRAIA